MKYLLIGIGGILMLYSSYPLFRYGFSFDIITDYGKGYVIGQLVLFLVGLLCMFIGIRKYILSNN